MAESTQTHPEGVSCMRQQPQKFCGWDRGATSPSEKMSASNILEVASDAEQLGEGLEP